MTKACSKCQQVREATCFRVNARYADGRVTWCRDCEGAYRKAHYQRNKDHIKAVNSEWHAANKDRRNEAARQAYAADPKRHAERIKRARARRPEHYRELARKGARQRRANCPNAAIRARISAQFRYCLSTGKGGRTSEQLLGYSIDELRAHLERQFLRGMSWGNMGEWHIDHIVPLSSFTITGPDDPELRRAWALTNLRPLWAEDNLAKSDRRETLL